VLQARLPTDVLRAVLAVNTRIVHGTHAQGIGAEQSVLVVAKRPLS
jgi:hypothetical protein